MADAGSRAGEVDERSCTNLGGPDYTVSYTELLLFKGDKIYDRVRYSNSWGGAARIWTCLFDSYVQKQHKYDCWMAGDQSRLWDLALRQDIPMFERAVHAFTFDRFFVKKENFSRFSKDLMSFCDKYACKRLGGHGDGVNHLENWAETLSVNTEATAVGLYGTSCGENPWYISLEDKEEQIPLSKGVEVYAWLDRGCKESEDTA